MAVLLVLPSAIACSSPALDDPFKEDKDAQTAGSCSMAGTWATFVEAGVEWESITISPGAGLVKQWILSRRTVENGVVRDQAVACGIGARGVKLGSPWFSTQAYPELGLESEWTGVRWKPELFDSNVLTPVPLLIEVPVNSSGVAALGAPLAVAPSPFEFGTRGLAGDAPWPETPKDILPYIVDPEGDASIGITGVPYEGNVPGAEEGTTFTLPRLETAENPARARELSLAIRSRAGLDGELVSCDPPRFEGHVIPNTLLIETRNVACVVDQTGEPCNETQINFIDFALPRFEGNNVAVFVSIKVPDDITCAEVRNLDFSPLTLPPLDRSMTRY